MQPSHIPKYFLAFCMLVGALLNLHADDTVYTKVDVKPIPIRTPPPEYPKQLKREGVSGVVAVSIVIDETGAVIGSSVVKSTNPDFNDATLDAVKKWKFKPALIDGKPVKMRVTLPIKFSLDD